RPALTSGRIIDLAVDPKDGRVWYIATAGGGVWKTTNSGTSFSPIFDKEKSFSIGCVTVDPRDSLVVWVGSGENNSQRSVSMGDGVYKSIDGGKSWKNVGLEKSEHISKIAVDPRDSNVVYVAAQGPQYYGEIFVDPNDDERIYSADVWVRVSDDGGKTWRKLDEKWKHPDNHVVWIDPANSDHLLIGCDGGLYESLDRAESWSFKANLPVTQFYRVSADDALPFYSVYGGTQDNFSLGGPSRTTDAKGIAN